MDTALASPRSCVTPYPTQVAQGMLWVLPVSGSTEADQPALPLIPELDDPDCVCQDIFRDLPMDYATLLENVMDVSHVPFTHHNSVGKRENATPVVLEMKGELRPGGFTGIWEEGPRSGKYGSQFTEFVAPSLMRHTLRTDQFTTLTVVYAVPTTPGRCRLMARFPFIFKAALPRAFFKIVPRWWSHLSQNAILEDDQIFLHKQERTIEIERDVKKRSYAQACYMPTKADTYVAAFRRWIVDMAGGSPAWPEGTEDALPPRAPTKEELLDRYFAHTVNCKSCSVALANLTKARKALRVVSLVALASAAAAFARAAPTKLVVALAVLAAATAATREFMGGLVQKMKVGPYPPPRRPPSMMEAALESARLAGA
jgi:phenylpropionate dioxygenase-like ring-hydroxylating dioxygenase large terminal subunit